MLPKLFFFRCSSLQRPYLYIARLIKSTIFKSPFLGSLLDELILLNFINFFCETACCVFWDEMLLSPPIRTFFLPHGTTRVVVSGKPVKTGDGWPWEKVNEI